MPPSTPNPSESLPDESARTPPRRRAPGWRASWRTRGGRAPPAWTNGEPSPSSPGARTLTPPAPPPPSRAAATTRRKLLGPDY
eukprot:447491-Prorocentrum_minimum.AAC.2